MKRALGCLAVVALAVAGPLLTGTASASKPSHTTITLTCDKDQTSRATVVLFSDHTIDSQVHAPVTLHCDRDTRHKDSVTVSTTAHARFASIDPWTYRSGELVLGCAGGVELPVKEQCPKHGSGSSLHIH